MTRLHVSQLFKWPASIRMSLSLAHTPSLVSIKFRVSPELKFRIPQLLADGLPVGGYLVCGCAIMELVAIYVYFYPDELTARQTRQDCSLSVEKDSIVRRYV